MRGRLATLALAVLVLACGGEDTSTGEPEAVEAAPSLVAGVESLQRMMTADPALGALADVDRAIDEDKPVLAARLLDTGAVPATRTQIERLRELELPSRQASELRDEAITLYEARLASLELYARALERGMVEDFGLLAAISSQREAEQAMGAFLVRLEAIRPLRRAPEVEPDTEPEADGREARP